MKALIILAALVFLLVLSIELLISPNVASAQRAPLPTIIPHVRTVQPLPTGTIPINQRTHVVGTNTYITLLSDTVLLVETDSFIFSTVVFNPNR